MKRRDREPRAVDPGGEVHGHEVDEQLSADELPTVLTVDEAAALLRVNRKTIYEAVARRQLPGARRIGRVIRISRQAVLDWLKQDRVSHREGGSR